MSVLYDSQEYKSFEIYAVIIKISTIRSLVYFHFFEALNNGAFEVQFFSGLNFYTLSKTLIACRDMQLRFFKVKTLLNNAFNLCYVPGVPRCTRPLRCRASTSSSSSPPTSTWRGWWLMPPGIASSR